MSKPSETDGKQPVHTIRHRNIKATIWRNQTDTGPMYKVLVTRSYREGDGWRDTTSFGYDDLLIVAKLLNDAHSAITSMRARDTTRAAEPQARPQSPQPAPRTRPTSSTKQRKVEQ